MTKRCRLQNWGTLHAVSKVNQNNWGNKRDKQRLRVKSKQEKTTATAANKTQKCQKLPKAGGYRKVKMCWEEKIVV